MCIIIWAYSTVTWLLLVVNAFGLFCILHEKRERERERERRFLRDIAKVYYTQGVWENFTWS